MLSLADYLNYILGNLASVIDKHGGDILKFAGDAVIVCWTWEGKGPDDGSDLRALEVSARVLCASSSHA